MDVKNYYRTYSGSDAIMFILFPNTPPIALGQITTLSYSVYRDKKPVTTLGHINIRGITRGTRVVAGSMVFTVMGESFANELQKEVSWLKATVNIGENQYIKLDEFPVFDLYIVCANEYGAYADMKIYGLDITDEGQVISVEDMMTEHTLSFIARDIDTLATRKNFDKSSRNISDISYNVNNSLGKYTNSSLPSSSAQKGVISTKSNVNVYMKPISNSIITTKYPYNRTINIYGEENGYYKSDLGYINKSDVLTDYTSNYSLESINANSSPASIKQIQEALNKSISANLQINGEFDANTVNALKAYKSVYGIPNNDSYADELTIKSMEEYNYV